MYASVCLMFDYCCVDLASDYCCVDLALTWPMGLPTSQGVNRLNMQAAALQVLF